MEISEATSICNQLSSINIAFWNAPSKDDKLALKSKFAELCKKVEDAGYRISRRKDHEFGQLKPIFIPFKKKHACYEHVDVRPNGVTSKNDCTTRCLAYCLGLDYSILGKNQRKIALDEHGSPRYWNYECVWGKIFRQYGWCKIQLPRKMARFNLAKLTLDLDFPIATHSSHHVAAMLKGKVIDTWDSQGGRVDFVYVPSAKAEEFKQRVVA